MKKILLLLTLMSSTIYTAARPESALHKAVSNNDADLVNALIMQGHDVNALNEFGKPPLMYISSGTPDKPYAPFSIAQQLVAHGANVKASDKDGATSLHYLMLNTQLDLNPHQEQGIDKVIDYLIEHGADVNATTLIITKLLYTRWLV